jgi:hypothetical protein
VPSPVSPELGDGPSRSLAEQADYLSAHEKLYDTLFSRIRDALLTDAETDSDSKRQRWKLYEKNGLLWRNSRLVYTYLLRMDYAKMSYIGIMMSRGCVT